MKIFDVAIIGGGPAGSAAAIVLAREGTSVLLLEAKPVPHDTLCGEFLSPECQVLLAQLGMTEKILALRPKPIQHAALIADDGTRWTTPLPGGAWGLSRYQFDYALITEAQAHGATAHDAQPCVNVSGDLQHGFEVVARHTRSDTHETYCARAVISAHGKRSTMDRVLQRAFLGRAYSLFGMKRHFRGPPMPDGVALHSFAGGYCGLAEIEDGIVNVCFLANPHPHPRPRRAGRAKRAAGTYPLTLRYLPQSKPFHRGGGALPSALKGEGLGVRVMAYLAHANPVLGAWLRQAEPIGDQWHSVGALAFGARGATSDDILIVGDAAGLIAPLVGDGIAMALSSGQMCAAHALKFLQGELSGEALKANYTRAWNTAFLPRIRLANMLQSVALRPAFMRATLRLFQQMPSIGEWMVKHTRA